MNKDKYDYDVAFSFNAKDEGIAMQINDLLSERLTTFVYSERQREIAGTDGQESFSKVYGTTARVVVILYRPEWGETPWTRIERDAIKNRSLEDGWDFTVFVPTVENVTMPPWLPKTRLYVGLIRWGAIGAAAAIEARVTEHGGIVREERLADRAARYGRAEQLRQEQQRFLNSDHGVNAAKHANEELGETIKTLIAGETMPSLQYRDRDDYRIVSGIAPVNLVLDWRLRYSNSLEGVQLNAVYYKGFPKLPGSFGSMEAAVKLKTITATFGIVRPGEARYILKSDERQKEFSPGELAEHLLSKYLDIGEQYRDR